VGEERLHGLRVALQELAESPLVSLDEFIYIFYGRHL
jgi:hypothetical protein